MLVVDYQGIINAIADNLGIETQNARWVRIVKDDLLSESLKIFRKTEPIRKTLVVSITDSTSEITMPSDFIRAYEVSFTDSEDNTFPSKELTEEEFLRWKIDAQLNQTTSFNDLVTQVTPISQPFTQENADFDGLIGYNFANSFPVKLKFKPSVAGSVAILYSSLSIPDDIELEDSPKLNLSYRELLVLGVTLNHSIRRLSGAKDQIELFGLQAQIARWQKDYDETLNDFNGLVNTTSSTPRIVPFDFLNDSRMLVLKNYGL